MMEEMPDKMLDPDPVWDPETETIIIAEEANEETWETNKDKN